MGKDGEKRFRSTSQRVKYLQEDVPPELKTAAKQAMCVQDLSLRANAGQFDNPPYRVTLDHPRHLKVTPTGYTVKMTLREHASQKPILKKAVERRLR